MRTVELAKVAAAAETLRLRRIARRQAVRVAYGLGAAVFLLAVLGVAHVAIWETLRFWLTPIVSTLIVLAIDAVFAGVLGFMAVRSSPDSVEIEARQIRNQAVAELRSSLTLMAMTAEIAGLALRSGARSGARRGVANVVAEVVSRLIGR